MAEKKHSLNIEINIGGVKDVDIMLFTKHLAVALKSGVALIDALEILEEQAKGKMRNIIIDLSTSIRGGDSFHTALQKHQKYFSAIYLNMIRSGEASGTLAENLERLSKELKKSLQLKKKVKSAMIYPAIVFFAVFGLGMSVALFVLPKILPLFRTLDVDLPLTTKWLITIAEIFEAQGIRILLISIIAIIAFLWLIRRNFVKPFTHALVLKIPVVSTIVKNVNLERFNRTMGTLLDTGLTIDESLKITSQVLENRSYKKALLNMIPQITGGASIKEASAKYPKLFPPITAKMIGIGERTGNLSNTLSYLGDYYEEEVDEAVKNLSTIIEPVLLIFIGTIVGTVAIAILGPIYQITGNIRG